MRITIGIAGRWVGILFFAFTLGVFARAAWADEALTARNKDIVRNFYTTVLVGRDVDAAPKFLRADYIQHNPQVPTGLKGFMDAFRARFAQPLPSDYKRELLNVIGDNDMVVVYVPPNVDGQRWPTSSSARIRHVPPAGRHDYRALGCRLTIKSAKENKTPGVELLAWPKISQATRAGT